MLLSQRFNLLKNELCQSDFTTSELLQKLGDKSHCLAAVILSLPFLLPIPIPGLSTVMGLMITWVLFYWFVKKNIWIPKKWRNETLPAAVFTKVFEKGEVYAKKFEFLFKARGATLVHSFLGRLMVFLLIVISALFLALPLPPGTNFPPAVTIIILALSILFEDAWLMIFGFLVFSFNAFLMFVLVNFMWKESLPYIKSLLTWLS